MIQHLEITADLTITTLMDLKKLKALEETTNLKLNVTGEPLENTLMAMNHLKHEKEVHSLTR